MRLFNGLILVLGVIIGGYGCYHAGYRDGMIEGKIAQLKTDTIVLDKQETYCLENIRKTAQEAYNVGNQSNLTCITSVFEKGHLVKKAAPCESY